MKLIKMMMIAAITALAVMAATAPSASANAKVCSTTNMSGIECDGTAAHGFLYKGAIKASLTTGTTAKLTGTSTEGATGWTVTCSESTGEGEIENGETGAGKVTKVSFGTCTSTSICSSGLTIDTSASTTSPWKAAATTTTAGTPNTNGTMSILSTDVTMTTKCIGITTCIYKAENPVMDGTGSDVVNLMILHLETVTMTKTFGEEGRCGAKADWSATYTVTTPTTFMVV